MIAWRCVCEAGIEPACGFSDLLEGATVSVDKDDRELETKSKPVGVSVVDEEQLPA